MSRPTMTWLRTCRGCEHSMAELRLRGWSRVAGARARYHERAVSQLALMMVAEPGERSGVWTCTPGPGRVIVDVVEERTPCDSRI